MKKLVIVSERTRYHFQKPLEHLDKFEVFHLYKFEYPDLDTSKFKNLIQYKNIFDLYRKLSELKPDIIQGLEPYYGYSRYKIPVKILPILFTVMRFCKNTKTPYFFHVLENLTPEFKYKFAAPVMKYVARMYAKGAKFIFYLNEGARKNLEIIGAKDKILFGLWGIWGVDTAEFKPVKSDEQAILFAGKLCDEKGIFDFLKATEGLNNTVLIAGDGPARAKVGEIVEGEKNVRLLGSVLSHKMPEIFQKAYLFVSPSKSSEHSAEQIGMVNIEAMACGVPVVTYDSGSVKEFVPQDAGIVIKEGDIEGLAQAIKKILNDSAYHSKLSGFARAYAIEHYDAKKNVSKLQEVVWQKLDS